MAASNWTLTRQRAKTILGTVDGLTANRIVIGLKDWKPSDEFLRDLPTAGPFVLIRPTQQGDYNLSMKQCESTVDVVLYYGYPDDADQDFTAVEDLVALMMAKLFDPALWTTGNRPWQANDVDYDDSYSKKPRIIEYTITMGFKAPLFATS